MLKLKLFTIFVVIYSLQKALAQPLISPQDTTLQCADSSTPITKPTHKTNHETSCQIWDGSGKYIERELVFNTKTGGQKETLFDADKNILRVTHYESGVKNGLETSYIGNGNDRVTDEVMWRQGKKHGLSQRYSRDKLLSKSDYQDGKLVKFSSFYSNGQPSIVMEGEDKNLLYAITRWYSNGKIRSQQKFAQGYDSTLLNEPAQEEMRMWYLNGQLGIEKTLVQGQEVQSKYWDMHGKEFSSQPDNELFSE